MKHPTPDRRTCERAHELNRIWQTLTIRERNSWLRLARSIQDKRAPESVTRLIETALILALALMWFFPFSLRSTLLALGAGYVLAVNLAIVRVCWEGMEGRLR